MSTNRRPNKRTARQIEMCVRRQVGGYSHQEIVNLYARDKQRVDPLSLIYAPIRVAPMPILVVFATVGSS